MKNNQAILYLQIVAGLIFLAACAVIFFYFLLFLFGGFHDWVRNIFLGWLTMFLIVLVIFVANIAKGRKI